MPNSQQHALIGDSNTTVTTLQKYGNAPNGTLPFTNHKFMDRTYSSATSYQSNLQAKLNEELSIRKQQEEYIQQLQMCYDTLLAKHALAEVTIDHLRTGARIHDQSLNENSNYVYQGETQQEEVPISNDVRRFPLLLASSASIDRLSGEPLCDIKRTQFASTPCFRLLEKLEQKSINSSSGTVGTRQSDFPHRYVGNIDTCSADCCQLQEYTSALYTVAPDVKQLSPRCSESELLLTYLPSSPGSIQAQNLAYNSNAISLDPEYPHCLLKELYHTRCRFVDNRTQFTSPIDAFKSSHASRSPTATIQGFIESDVVHNSNSLLLPDLVQRILLSQIVYLRDEIVHLKRLIAENYPITDNQLDSTTLQYTLIRRCLCLAKQHSKMHSNDEFDPHQRLHSQFRHLGRELHELEELARSLRSATEAIEPDEQDTDFYIGVPAHIVLHFCSSLPANLFTLETLFVSLLDQYNSLKQFDLTDTQTKELHCLMKLLYSLSTISNGRSTVILSTKELKHFFQLDDDTRNVSKELERVIISEREKSHVINVFSDTDTTTRRRICSPKFRISCYAEQSAVPLTAPSSNVSHFKMDQSASQFPYDGFPFFTERSSCVLNGGLTDRDRITRGECTVNPRCSMHPQHFTVTPSSAPCSVCEYLAHSRNHAVAPFTHTCSSHGVQSSNASICSPKYLTCTNCTTKPHHRCGLSSNNVTERLSTRGGPSDSGSSEDTVYSEKHSLTLQVLRRCYSSGALSVARSHDTQHHRSTQVSLTKCVSPSRQGTVESAPAFNNPIDYVVTMENTSHCASSHNVFKTRRVNLPKTRLRVKALSVPENNRNHYLVRKYTLWGTHNYYVQEGRFY